MKRITFVVFGLLCVLAYTVHSVRAENIKPNEIAVHDVKANKLLNK